MGRVRILQHKLQHNAHSGQVQSKAYVLGFEPASVFEGNVEASQRFYLPKGTNWTLSEDIAEEAFVVLLARREPTEFMRMVGVDGRIAQILRQNGWYLALGAICDFSGLVTAGRLGHSAKRHLELEAKNRQLVKEKRLLRPENQGDIAIVQAREEFREAEITLARYRRAHIASFNMTLVRRIGGWSELSGAGAMGIVRYRD